MVVYRVLHFILKSKGGNLCNHVIAVGGDVARYKLKPCLIYWSLNSCALRNVNKHALPVFYRANSKAWMTQAIFKDWFFNCFMPENRQYCIEKGIPLKTLLLIDNAPGHRPHVGDLQSNVKVVYLPKNTTSILQPMDQGAIANFKVRYLRITFSKAILATEDDAMDLRQFWKDYNILHSIKNIEEAWKQVTVKCMQGN